MKNSLRFSVLLTAVLSLITLIDNVSALSEDEEITSQVENGFWVNETLNISGSTTINPQSAQWVIYNVTEPYISWPVVASGEFFTSAIPISEGIWIWNIEVNLSGIKCTCWLEINQPIELDKSFFNRIFFVGDGPHKPIVSPHHELQLFLDENLELTGQGIISEGTITNTKIKLEWCYSPQGACTGDIETSEIVPQWTASNYTFTLNATELGLYDGVWNFTYYMQDEFLRHSPKISVNLFVDQTDPVVELIAPTNAQEGVAVFIDGSGSRDGVWGNNLQTLWYITKPDGSISVITSNSTQKFTHTIVPQYSGNYTIRLDIFDAVGRTASQSLMINVENLEPTIQFFIDGMDITDSDTWRSEYGDEIHLEANISDSELDIIEMKYTWYLDGEVISTNQNATLPSLSIGSFVVILEVEDNDGATSSHEIQVIVETQDTQVESMFVEVTITIILILIPILLSAFAFYKQKSSVSKMPKWEGMDTSDSREHSDEVDDWN